MEKTINLSEVSDAIKSIIINTTNAEVKHIDESFQNMGIDSLEVLEVTQELESMYNIKIDDNHVSRSCHNVHELSLYVLSLINSSI